MPGKRYKLESIKSAVGEGATQSRFANIVCRAKVKTQQFPNIVANELICSFLAKAILLPIPPGLLFDEGGETYFASLDFNIAGKQLPPITPSKLVKDNPDLSWGVLLFDIWVLNGDRHNRNLAYDESKGQGFIFDHSHAFYHSWDGNKTPQGYIEDQEEKLGIRGHCLKNEIDSLDGFDKWMERIKLVPDYYIEEVIFEGEGLGYPNGAGKFCVDFFLERKEALETIIEKNKPEFTKIKNW